MQSLRTFLSDRQEMIALAGVVVFLLTGGAAVAVAHRGGL